MTTLSQMVSTVATYTGLPASRCRQVARRLREAGHLPSSSGRSIARVGLYDIAVYIMGILAGTSIANVPQTTASMFDLRDEHGVTAGHHLYETLLTLSLQSRGNEFVRALSTDLIVGSDGCVTFVDRSTSTKRKFAAPGADAHGDKVSAATTLPGKALAHIAAELTRRPHVS